MDINQRMYDALEWPDHPKGRRPQPQPTKTENQRTEEKNEQG